MSEVILLDTHIWLWLINGDFDQFPSHWVEKLERVDVVGVSPLSCYEIALACQRQRLQLTCRPEEWIRQALDPAGIEILPLTATIAARAVNLSPIHRDPFDRMIIATALVYQAQLASIDGLFGKYPELENYLMR
ncbi:MULTISPECIES: type II toxin-antitoxin system VapC family toxin [Cyanophyceae]|uniref:type II toxin-antitoxin system VapC family toxin n=1 Tax=Cyanophyceae TaxID=3028117 RepID=UPI0004ABB806|nr:MULTISPECIES: type II toxin-antitoxin system VapC family toxin [Cyanophyceae]